MEYLLITLVALAILGFVGWRLVKTQYERYYEGELIDVQIIHNINPHKGKPL